MNGEKVRSKILKVLKENQSKFISGEALSEVLGVSRTAVWKHIKELKAYGYVIESSSKKGYKLTFIPDILDSDEISHELNTEIIGRRIVCFDTIDSTNNYAKKIASENCEEGTVIVAESQTAGRGRLGREWSSIDKKGIWMSIVLRPEMLPEEVQIITLAASIAVVSAVKRVTGIETGIKWPNDIILEGKKVCGILTEMNSEMEKVNYLIIGIGINVNHDKEDLSHDILHKAISLKMYNERVNNIEEINSGNFNRNELIKSILFEMEQKYSKIKKGLTDEVIEEWKRYSVTLGKEIKIVTKNKEYIAMAEDITPEGKLTVRCKDGIIKEISSGEISVRGILGYI